MMIQEGKHFRGGVIHKIREDGRCIVLDCSQDLGCKARILLLQENGSWLTAAYCADLPEAMLTYAKKYAWR